MSKPFENVPEWMVSNFQHAEVLIRIGIRNAIMRGAQEAEICTCGECDEERMRANIAAVLHQADRTVCELDALYDMLGIPLLGAEAGS